MGNDSSKLLSRLQGGGVSRQKTVGPAPVGCGDGCEWRSKYEELHSQHLVLRRELIKARAELARAQKERPHRPGPKPLPVEEHGGHFDLEIEGYVERARRGGTFSTDY